MTDTTTIATSFVEVGFRLGDNIKITAGHHPGDMLRILCRRQFWYRPWTWFMQNYAIRKISKITNHSIDLEGVAS